MNLQLFAGERTEQATPRRLEKARQRGQVFKSMEVISAATLLGAYAGLQTAGPLAWAAIAELAGEVWGHLSRPDLQVDTVVTLLIRMVQAAALAVGPVVGMVLVAGLTANYAQVGFVFSLEPLFPQFSRIDPMSGLQRLFSKRALVELVKALLKVSIIGYVSYLTVRSDLVHFPELLDAAPAAAAAQAAATTTRVILRVALVMLALAAADWLYQRFEYETSLRMTKQEVKQEHRESEGSPELKQQIRRRQRAAAARRMMHDVPKADVVVTNPTHYAVALRYRPGEAAAPKVLAKGQGFIALRIRDIARQSQVPVVENPPLARALHASVEIGDMVPPELYQAVAEVLAYVYRLRGDNRPPADKR